MHGNATFTRPIEQKGSFKGGILSVQTLKTTGYASSLMLDYEDKTLEELESVDWQESDYGSYVVRNCQRLLRVPIQKFTIEDLRLMIGQGIGLKYLVPVALVRLGNDPLAAGVFLKEIS